MANGKGPEIPFSHFGRNTTTRSAACRASGNSFSRRKHSERLDCTAPAWSSFGARGKHEVYLRIAPATSPEASNEAPSAFSSSKDMGTENGLLTTGDTKGAPLRKAGVSK